MNEDQVAVEIHEYPGNRLPTEYLNLVRSRWMRSYRHQNDFMKLIYAASYYAAYSAYIANLLNRPNTTVRLAVLADDPDVVLGFAVVEKNILHYVEVKRDYRRNGIAKNLIHFGNTKVDWISHLTKTGLTIWARCMPDVKFSPFI